MHEHDRIMEMDYDKKLERCDEKSSNSNNVLLSSSFQSMLYSRCILNKRAPADNKSIPQINICNFYKLISLFISFQFNNL